MPLVSHTSKERVEMQHQLMIALESKCSVCELFKGMSPDSSYIYTLRNSNFTEPVMLAFAQYNDCKAYAVYASEDLTEKQLSVFEYFLREVKQYAEENEQIVVFSQKNYDAIMKYNYSEPISVKLYA